MEKKEEVSGNNEEGKKKKKTRGWLAPERQQQRRRSAERARKAVPFFFSFSLFSFDSVPVFRLVFFCRLVFLLFDTNDERHRDDDGRKRKRAPSRNREQMRKLKEAKRKQEKRKRDRCFSPLWRSGDDAAADAAADEREKTSGSRARLLLDLVVPSPGPISTA